MNSPEELPEREARGKNTSLNTTLTVVGFVLFLAGGMLIGYGAVDAIGDPQTLRTLCYLSVGLAMYKAGRFVLHQCATLRQRHSRRKQVFS